MKLIIGLGNPGKEYTETRHNAGWLVFDRLVQLGTFSDFKFDKKFSAEIAVGMMGTEKILLVKPQTFMNESGVAVRALFDFYKLTLNDLLVIHDDKDIPLGEYRWQSDRGSAGHNGIISIIAHLGSQAFTRLRLGIAAPVETPHVIETSDFVLGRFSSAEKKMLLDTFEKAEPLIREWVRG